MVYGDSQAHFWIDFPLDEVTQCPDVPTGRDHSMAWWPVSKGKRIWGQGKNGLVPYLRNPRG